MSKNSGRAYAGATYPGPVMSAPERANAQVKNKALQIAAVLRDLYRERLSPKQLNELVGLLATNKVEGIHPTAAAGGVEVAAMIACPDWFRQQMIYLSNRGIRYVLEHAGLASVFPRTGLDEAGVRILGNGKKVTAVHVRVQYRRRRRAHAETIRETLVVNGGTIEAVMAAVKFKHPRWEIVSLEIE